MQDLMPQHKDTKAEQSEMYRFIRFLLVGVLNTLVGYGCFALLLHLGLHYTFALFIATILGVLFNFKSIGSLVFRSNNKRLLHRFIGVYALIYSLNAVGIKLLLLAGIHPYLGGACLILPLAGLSFFLNKKFVFIK